ncbi:uncharacterized protein DUF1292 [Hydrogenoanaerobacterium saccharovorans]|uniref:Uncharacterized protein n=2 Tax=Hydrogenoanaerobacterium saccharovorans TaxID=474960 RepID=A0A1H8A7U6_9FIRM|nr:uncharacterized protein DUF1292 [Hydrogenoanaerobacterium saccharovorans]SEM65888.1 Protein of unknown function [Hydrogenoanaerobacterium saccharovorans]
MDTNEEMEFGPDILTLQDEEGVEHEFEVLDTYEEDHNRYIAVIPVEDEEVLADDDGELIVLKVEADGDEEFLMAIEDEDEFNKISGIFMERLEDYYDFTEE